jgi:hypothetical protein
MNKELSRNLLPLVNDHQTMVLLEEYVKARIEVLRDCLEHDTFSAESRGAIKELRRFFTLRDEVNSKSKEK